MFLLLSRLRGWDATDYWKPSHPSQVAYRDAVARVYGTPPAKLQAAIDGCGIETYAFRLREVARAYAMLADPAGIPSSDPRSELAGSLTTIRDAMMANPEMVAGRHDRIDTSLMKAAPGRLVSKGGMEALRAIAILPGARSGTNTAGASGMAIKIEDGDALRPRDVGGDGRGAPAGRRRRRRLAARPGALPPAGGPRPARPGRGRDRARVRARAGG